MSDDELRILTELFGEGVAERTQGDLRLIILPSVTLPDGCTPQKTFGIYVASPTAGYDSRLFFDVPIKLKSSVQPQTTTLVLVGRTMHAASIQGVPSSLPPHQAILVHLNRYENAT
jgi:hypothetical protein